MGSHGGLLALNFKIINIMAKNFYVEENYREFYLKENWTKKGIRIKKIALHLFPKTDDNPNDLIGIQITGCPSENVVDYTTGEVLVEAGEAIHPVIFPRNLPGKDWKKVFGAVEEKDGKKVFTPKFTPLDAFYRIGQRRDEDGNPLYDAAGNPIWGNPKLIEVLVSVDENGVENWLHIGSDDEPVPFNG